MRTLTVYVKPGSQKGPLLAEEGGRLIAYVRERAVDGAANKALVRLIAKTYGIAPSLITVKSGLTGRTKLLQIDN